MNNKNFSQEPTSFVVAIITVLGNLIEQLKDTENGPSRAINSNMSWICCHQDMVRYQSTLGSWKNTGKECRIKIIPSKQE